MYTLWKNNIKFSHMILLIRMPTRKNKISTATIRKYMSISFRIIRCMSETPHATTREINIVCAKKANNMCQKSGRVESNA